MPISLLKSAQEKDLDRRMQVKQGRRKVERYITNQQKQVQKYWELAKRAYRLSDREVLLRLVSLIARTRRSVHEWERRLLYFDMIEAQRDQALAGADFAQAFDAMSKTILAHADPKDLSRIQLNLERSMLVAEELEDRLGDFQSSLDEMLSQADSSEEKKELAEILRMIESEATQEPEAELDADIDATMKQIEALLGRKE